MNIKCLENKMKSVCCVLVDVWDYLYELKVSVFMNTFAKMT